MSRRNYFEILRELSFDPPEKNEKKIKKHIEEWKQKQEDALASETRESYRNNIQEELALYDDMVKILTDSKLRKDEAVSMKKIRSEQLEQLLSILMEDKEGTLEVTNAQIREVSRKLGISQDTAKKIYTQNGFQIQQRNTVKNLDEYFLKPVIADGIREKLDKLKTVRIQEFPWTLQVNDLYDVACFASGGTKDDIDSYHKRRTADIYSIMDAWSIKKASDMSPEGHLLKDVFSAGTAQVFKDEESRRKYDNTLQREKLNKFFVLLKSAPEVFKKDRSFAESCIRIIQKHFPDYDLSLALYNREAGLIQDPYEPVEALVHVYCPSCKTSNEFRSVEEAQRGKCKLCGSALYIRCPRCSKSVPATADRCSCGFSIFEMQFFEEYYQAAIFALGEMDFVEAKKQLKNAENAYPSHPKLAALEKQIEDADKMYRKPVTELDNNIASGYILKAQELFQKISVSMPNLNLEKQRKQISQRLDEAQRKMPSINTYDTSAVRKLLSILETVKDYQPAIDCLKLIKPKNPSGLHVVTKNGKGNKLSITWEAANDIGIQYKVVRKTNGIPTTHTDGNTISDGTTALQCTDVDVKPGCSYGYAVFAYRYGIYSNPAIYEFVNCSELEADKLIVNAGDRVCSFSWTLPLNAIGVRIIRMEGGIPSPGQVNNVNIIADCAATGFEDRNVKNGVSYGYRFQCVYSFGAQKRYSNPGITKLLLPDVQPIVVEGIKTQIESRQVSLHWKVKGSVCQKLLVQQAPLTVRNIIGQILPSGEINALIGNGKIYGNTTTDKLQCSFNIPESSSLHLAVVVMSGTQGVVSETVNVSSVEKCEINRTQTRIDGKRLLIYLDKLPEYIEKIHYTFEQKVGSSAPWAKIEDAKQNRLSIILAEDYLKDGMIIMEPIPQTDIYVSVIGQYRMKDGTVVYSEPSKIKLSNRPKQEISYYLKWSGGGLFSKGKRTCKLCFDTSAEDRPEMYLVCRTDGRVPMNAAGLKVISILEISEKENGFIADGKEYKVPNIESLSSGTELRLFLSEDFISEYDLDIANVKSLKVP